MLWKITPFHLALIAIALAVSSPSSATTVRGTPLSHLSTSAETIVRGQCLSAKVEMADVAGARLPVTVYTFRVTDQLKGDPRAEISFRQVGTPAREALDLGRLAGLPVYHAGNEYVLFLLPESRHGLTSPSGAGEGAFAVSGNSVVPMRGSLQSLEDSQWAREPATSPAFSYAAFREAVLREMGR